jgi:hypothetical protein
MGYPTDQDFEEARRHRAPPGYNRTGSVQSRFLASVVEERIAQIAKWGDQSGKAPAVWVAILAEECGEVANAVLERDDDNLKKELVQVAAVCCAFVEAVALWPLPDRGSQAVQMRPGDAERGKEARDG